MGGTSSATVETLVAEVRVLMVGSRQITLSVARQLDRVDLEAMEPFGRVRLGDGATVIGRERASGALVVAHYEVLPFTVRVTRLPRPITVCCKYTGLSVVEVFRMQFEGTPVLVPPGLLQTCGVREHHYRADEACDPPIQLHGQDVIFRAAVEAEFTRQQRHEAMDALPLIVLAGLR